ncbi:hypothetical protein [Aeromicrobium alkaliterrae]|uniref:Integral membrane protein n=1 Tax=Aeromicrobium alkaliterrae TaxID=302168 RepID=A0ABP4VG47_9ACTN
MSNPWPPTARRFLTVAALVVALEAFAVIAFAVVELSSLDSGRLGVGVSSAVFFVAYGALQLTAGVLLLRGRTGARGPIVATQLLQLGIAWNLRGADPDTVVVPNLALLVALAAGVVLVCVLAPPVNRSIMEREAAEAAEASGETSGDA